MNSVNEVLYSRIKQLLFKISPALCAPLAQSTTPRGPAPLSEIQRTATGSRARPFIVPRYSNVIVVLRSPIESACIVVTCVLLFIILICAHPGLTITPFLP